MTLLRRGIWLALMAGLLLLMLAQAVMPIPRERLFIESVLDLGHVPLFAVFTVLILALLLEMGRIRRRPIWVAYSITLVISLFMGVATELLQSRVSRDADPLDFERDVYGAAAAILAVVAWRAWRRRQRARAWLAGALALAGLVAGGWAPVHVLLDYRSRDASFPVLADFERGWIRTFLSPRESTADLVACPQAWTGHGGRVLEVDYEATDYPALTLVEPVSDWSAYRRLEFDVFNPEARGMDLLLRVDDYSHNGYYSDRYNGRIALGPGANHVAIPLEEIREAPRTRSTNLHAMRSVTFFIEKQGTPVTLYFDDVALGPTITPQR